ncbi:MAG: ABC transporter permease [Candidatus Faecisoma sp.]|nr:ABC transporter permease [Acholeplasma sp.]MCI5677734.1 ABC transporter permease [Acholeplasma sp.]MDY2892211.1 ABC transporter permease [Candidatus Faecisoma sp.]
MKNKLKFLIKQSLERKTKTKWFLVANIALAVLIIGIINIDSVIKFFGGDFDSKTNIYVIDNTNKAYSLFDGYINKDDSNYNLSLYDKTYDEAVTMLKENEEEKNSIVIVFDNDEENVISVKMITNDYLDLVDIPVITTAINNTKLVMAIEKHNISEEELNALTSSVNIDREVLNKDSSVDENMNIIMTSVFPVVILPFFMLSIFLVQMIGAEVNDEKTTKGMEIIISNVSPKVHFFSKVIAGNIFVIIQGLLLIGYGIIGFILRGNSTITAGATDIIGDVVSMIPQSFMDSLSYLIPLILILMLVTMVGYSLLAGILSSMTTNTEDFQQIQSPIMIISLLGYYLAMMAGVFKGALFIKILGFFPFISAILAPSLLVLGQFTIIDFVIAIFVMIIVIYLLIKYGLKIYKVGILNYSSGGMFKKMYEALKAKD